MTKKQELSSKGTTKAQLLCVSLGAILGAYLRGVAFTNMGDFVEASPYYKLIIINVIGSVIFAAIAQFDKIIPKEIRLFLLTGFCASFTTFSLSIAQAQYAVTAMDLNAYMIALFGNFFACVISALIAMTLADGIRNVFRRAK